MSGDTYYVYVFVDPRKPGIYNYGDYSFLFEPFYVGKGKGNRLKRHLNESQLNSNNNPHKERILKKIIKKGFDPIQYAVIIKNSITESNALDLEKNIIQLIGRHNLNSGSLTNLTDGGEGMSNYSSPFKGKTYEEMFGIEKANQLKFDKSKLVSGSSNPMFGKTSFWKGKSLSSNTKNKISESKRKPVKQIDTKTKEVIEIFSCPNEASKKLSISLSGIHNCLSPNQPSKSSAGFIWEYV